MGDVDTPTRSGATPELHPAILRQIGDQGRPLADFDAPTDLSGFPDVRKSFLPFEGLANLVLRGVDFNLDMGRWYGPLFVGSMGPNEALYSYDVELNQLILRNSERGYSAPLGWWKIFGNLEPSMQGLDGLLGVDFEVHRDFRRWFQPGFTNAAMTSYMGMARERFLPAIDSWIADGEVRFKPAIRRLLAGVANKIFLGRDDAKTTEVYDTGMRRFWSKLLAVVPDARYSPVQRRAIRAWRRMVDELRDSLPQRRRTGGDDLFSRLVTADDRPDWVDDDVLVRSYVGLMSAAFDTTAHGMASMGYLLATHPDWQERLREEAMAVDEPLEFAQLGKLVWADRAWKETLRMYPVAQGAPRRCMRDFVWKGRTIPAGTLVVCMLAAPMRDPERWTHAHAFEPDRFGPERAEDKSNRAAYSPFGAGAHVCIGARLSTLESVSFWHGMLRRCRFELAKPYVARHTYTPLGSVSGDVRLKVSRL